MPRIEAVILDLDGVIIDSENVWERARRAYVAEAGGTYAPSATRDVMGMSAPEWSHYIRTRLGVDREEAQINADVVARVAAEYATGLPLFGGAVQAVRRLAARVPLGLASSSNRSLIDLALASAGIADAFAATVSSEEAGRGKPAPDVYLLAARRLGVAAERCGAVEDSTNGIRSAHAAAMFVVAIPQPAFPPDPEALALADVRLGSMVELEPRTFGLQ